MLKKKLQFLVTEDIFNQFETIRKAIFSSTAKQTLLHSIFTEWLSYQQRGGNRVWEPSKNGVKDIPVANVVTSPITSQKNTKTTSFTSGICVISPVRQFRSSPVGYTNFWTNVSQTNISSLIPLRVNSHLSYTDMFSSVTETSDENSFRS